MANTTLQFIKIDFASQKDALLQRIRSRWSGSWTDFSNSNFGMLLVDIVAYALSTFGYIVNRIAGENFITTMTLRESAVRLGAFANYSLRGPVASTISCQATVPNDSSSRVLNITIAKGTQVKTNDGNNLVFEVAQDYQITPGNVTPITPVTTISPSISTAGNIQTGVVATAGSPYLDLQNGQIDLTQYVQPGQSVSRFDPTGLTLSALNTQTYSIISIESAPGAASNNRMVLATNWVGDSGTWSFNVVDTRIALVQGSTVVDQYVSPAVETPGYILPLQSSPLIQGSVSVTVNGIQWTAVNSLLTQDAAATVFQVKPSASGAVYVVFGDGTFGSLIPTQASVVITYRIGGGSVGNVQIGAISTQISGIIEPLNTLVTVNVSNATNAGQGGQDPEGLEEARANIPAYIQANGRAVTLSDYETLATLFVSPTGGGVSFARAATRTENALLEGNVVVVYAWTSAAGGGLTPVTGNFQDQLQSYLQGVAVGTDYVLVSEGTSTPFPLAVRFQTSAGFDVTTVTDAVQSAITSTINALTPGQSVIFSDLVQIIAGVSGVSNVVFASPNTNLLPSTSYALFTPPDSTVKYSVALTSLPNGGYIYAAQSPVVPLTPWSFQAFLGGQELLVAPDEQAGYARLFGSGLVNYMEGLAANQPDPSTVSGYYYFATDVGPDGTLYLSNGTSWTQALAGSAGKSLVNLATGAISLSVSGSPGTFQMSLNSYQGYSSLRAINLYVGYSGDNTPITRAAIRQALRTWIDGFSVGTSLYASVQPGIIDSMANVTNVVLAVNGVTSVNHVAFISPANNSSSVTAAATDLFTFNTIVLNGSQV